MSKAVEKLSVHQNSVQHLPFDLSHLSNIPDLVKEINLIWGKVGVLVNNAAMALFERIEYMDPKDMDQIIRLNVQASYILIQQLLPNLMKTKGCIINISSYFSK